MRQSKIRLTVDALVNIQINLNYVMPFLAINLYIYVCTKTVLSTLRAWVRTEWKRIASNDGENQISFS